MSLICRHLLNLPALFQNRYCFKPRFKKSNNFNNIKSCSKSVFKNQNEPTHVPSKDKRGRARAANQPSSFVLAPRTPLSQDQTEPDQLDNYAITDDGDPFDVRFHHSRCTRVVGFQLKPSLLTSKFN